MGLNRRGIIAIGLVAVLIVAVVAVALTSGLLQSGEAADLTDAAGREVILDAPPERIVSCTPGLTEMVFALGLGDKLVAVTDYCDYPAEAAALRDANKTVGGFWEPNYEVILSYDPDLVLVDYGTDAHQQLASKLIDANVTVLQMFEQKNLASVYANLGLLGKVTGTSENATVLANDIKASIESVQSAVEGLDKPTVMYVTYVETGFTNAYVSGSGTAVDELIGLAGGKNVFADQSGWFSPSSELMLSNAKSIDCMIITSMFSDTAAEDLNDFFVNDELWKQSPAVMNNKIFYLQGQGENIFNRQSVRAADAVQLMAEMMHPGAFEAKVPYDPTGGTINVIGNDYADHLPSVSSSVALERAYSGPVAMVRD